MQKDKYFNFLISPQIENRPVTLAEVQYLCKNEDGSVELKAVDGSWGIRNEDGSVDYKGANGSWGYVDVKGVGAYFFNDGSQEIVNLGNFKDSTNFNPNESGGSNTAYQTNVVGYSDDTLNYHAKEVFESFFNDAGAFSNSIKLMSSKLKSWTSTIDDVMVGFNTIDLLGQDINTVNDTIKSNGFTNIHYYKIEDVFNENLELEDCVEKIRFNYNPIVQKGDIYSSNARVQIYFHTRNLKHVKYNFAKSDFVGISTNEVKDYLRAKGFLHILEDSVYDIDNSNLALLDTVKEVKFSEAPEKSFLGNVMLKTTTIKLLCHKKKRIEIDFTNESLKNKNYNGVISKLREYGFVNIQVNPVRDLMIGFLSRDNDVCDVYIAGKLDYQSGNVFNYDVDIDINYHAFAYRSR